MTEGDSLFSEKLLVGNECGRVWRVYSLLGLFFLGNFMTNWSTSTLEYKSIIQHDIGRSRLFLNLCIRSGLLVVTYKASQSNAILRMHIADIRAAGLQRPIDWLVSCAWGRCKRKTRLTAKYDFIESTQRDQADEFCIRCRWVTCTRTTRIRMASVRLNRNPRSDMYSDISLPFG